VPDRFVLPLALSSEGSYKARVLAYGHSVFDNLAEGDLENWRGDGVVARSLLEKPQKGNFLVLVDGLSIQNEHNATGALIVEMPYRKGRFLFSQLLIMEKLDSEPVAGILLGNIIRYALTSHTPYEKVALFGQEESHGFNFFKELGVVAIENPTAIDEFGKIIITQQEYFESNMIKINKDFFVDLNRFIQKGGKLIIFNLNPQIYNALRQVFPVEITFAKSETQKVAFFKKDNPLFWGISEEELGECRLFDYSLKFRHTREALELLSPGRIALFNSGKGQIIVSQLNFFQHDEKLSNRVASQFMTNLGIAIEAEKYD
jgi:hypothetical protein